MRKALAVLLSGALLPAQVPAAWANRLIPGKPPGTKGPGAAAAMVRLQSLIAPLNPGAPVPSSQSAALSRVPGAALAPLAPPVASLELPAAAASILSEPAEVDRLVPALSRVREVVAGMTPERLEAMGDGDIATLAARIFDLAAEGGSPPESLPAAPESVTGFLKEIAPGIQAELDRALEMDPSKPETCVACGPASLGTREHLESLLEARFSGQNIKVRVVPGTRDGEGDTRHVLLEVYQPDPATPIFIKQRLAVYDPTAAQRPGNMRAMGLEPGEPAVFAWAPDVYERYGFFPMHPKEAAELLAESEKTLMQYGSATRRLIDSFRRERGSTPSSRAGAPR